MDKKIKIPAGYWKIIVSTDNLDFLIQKIQTFLLSKFKADLGDHFETKA
jgi:DNA/RNA endonuclease G (NUC1)